VHDLSIRDILTWTMLSRAQWRPAWNTVAASQDQRPLPVNTMGIKGTDEDAVLVTEMTLRPEAPVSPSEDGAAGQDLIERIGGKDHVQFLAEASEILADSLDYETELERVARLIVPALADWCVVDLLVADGRMQRLAVVHRDPAKAGTALELRRRYAVLPPNQAHRAWDVLADGKPWFDPAVDEVRFVAEARDAEHLALLRRLGFAAEMVLPLVARGRTLGVITLVLADDHRHYGPDDLALAEELARRAALAIDNARLYAEAQAAEARYRGLFEGVADAILSIDDEGRFRDANVAAIELLGYEREELLGARLEDLIAPGAELAEVEVLWRPRDGTWHGELDLRRKDGAILTVEARTTVVALQAGPVALSVVRDVSERHRAAVDRQRLAAIVDSSNDVIIGKTLDGIVTSWNQAAEQLYGYTAEEMIGQSIARIFPPERIEEFRDIMDRIRRGERISHHDAVRIAKDGRRIDISVSVSPVTDAAGRIVGAATIAQDIGERKRIEAAQRDFLAMVSHDLRSPLTVIRASTQLLQRRGEYRESTIATILQYADRMARLIDDLADVVRLEEGHLPLQREPLDLVVLARECAAAAEQQSANHAVRVDAPESSICGMWDRVRLGQVLENLVSNALKHGAEEGEVVVRVEERDGEALISVRDSGPGVDPEHVPHLFDRFYRANTRSSGLGLGLYISRILVEAHGGRIWVESRLGQGSTFTIGLPLHS
jgi:PAS domain S-box-containing protein